MLNKHYTDVAEVPEEWAYHKPEKKRFAALLEVEKSAWYLHIDLSNKEEFIRKPVNNPCSIPVGSFIAPQNCLAIPFQSPFLL